MKKSLIALAVLAASGAAMAQSTVTLYGVADIFLANSKSGVGAASLTQTVLNSGGVSGSRWGLKGSEDLGGGLKANFQLESGFDISTGASQQAALFGRQAFVGLSGGFGSVNLGRQYSAYDSLRGATNNTYDSAVATTATVWGAGVADYTNRINNAIRFDTADFSGFSAAVMYGLGEDNATVGSSASANTSLHLKYAAGPLLVGYAYQDQKAAALAGATAATLTYNMLAGSYDFGMAKVVAGFNKAKNNAAVQTKDSEYQLGVNFPVGTAANVAVGYTHTSSDTANVNTKASGWSLAGYYSLSKRTSLYAGWNKTSSDSLGVTTTDTSLLAAGIKHTF